MLLVVVNVVLSGKGGVEVFETSPLVPKQQPGRTGAPFGAQCRGINVVAVVCSGRGRLSSEVGVLVG